MAFQDVIIIQSSGPGLIEFTNKAARFVEQASDKISGPALLTIFVRHTSCSLLIQENADPDVQVDLTAYMERLVPNADDKTMGYLIHRLEGPDDMPAHIKATLTQTSLTVPVNTGKLMLGTWQGIYLWEHRSRPHSREVVLHLA